MNVGSRLKTPVLPIWVTCVNDNWGVLFNPNRDLMKSYSAENRSSCLTVTCCSFFIFFRFQLYYFSNTLTKEKRHTVLMIDTRTKKSIRNMNDNDDIEEDTLEKAIQSK